MKFLKQSLTAAAMSCSVMLTAPASAATAVSISSFLTSLGDGPYTLGYSFAATQDMQVTALGAFDALGDGFGEAHEVGLWDSNGILLSSISVSSTDTLIDGFRYANITGVNLISGNSYIVAASNFGPRDAYAYSTTISTAPGISSVRDTYAIGRGLLYPTSSAGGNGYFGGNFQIASATGAAPEPGTWAMMILGFGLAGAALRRRPTVKTRVSYAV